MKIPTCILFILSFGFQVSVFSQSACPEAPDYGYYHYELDTAGYGITDQNYWIHYTTGPVDFIRSPFYDSGHNPIRPLEKPVPAFKDNKPEDGWGLVYHNFGWSKIDSLTYPIFSKSVHNPLIILYNKYNGTLRVLINLFQPIQGEDMISINLEFDHDENYIESALLSHTTAKINAVDNFTKEVLMSSISKHDTVTQNPKKWYFADFPMAYDPCTCTEDTWLKFSVRLIDEAKVELKASGTVVDSISSSGKKTEASGEKSVLNTAKKAVKSGVKAYNEGTKLQTQAEKALKGLKFEDEDTSGTSATRQSAIKSVIDFAEGLTKGVPIAKAAIGVFDFLLTGGKKTEVSATPKVSHLNITITGEIKFTNIYEDFSIVNPNSSRADTVSIQGSSWSWEDLPKTKHTLGICNLLESPVVEWVPILSRGNGAAVPNSVSAPDHSNALRHYNVQTPIRFVVNPATELELIELNAAMLLEYPPGAYIDPTFPSGCGLPANNVSGGPLRRDREDIFEQLAFHGLEVEAWPKAYPLDTAFVTTEADGPLILRTPYYHASCFDEISFMIHDTAQGFAAPTVIPEVYCKLQARLRRTDTLADDSTKDVIYIATYNVDLRRAFNGLPYGQCDTCSFFYGNSPDSVPPTAHTEVVYRTFFRDTTVHDDSLIIAGDKPWKLPWSDYFPGFFRSIALESENLQKDTTIFAREFVLLYNDFSAQADPGADINIYAGERIVVVSDTGEVIILEADTLGSVVLEVTPSGAPPYFSECLAEPLDSVLVTEAYVQDFCNDPLRYNPEVDTSTSNRVAVNDDPPAPERLPKYEHLRVRAYPNPFSERVAFAFELPEAMPVTVELYDLQGRRVARLAENKYLSAGYHELHYGGGGLTPGLYLCKIRGGDRYLETLRLMKH